MNALMDEGARTRRYVRTVVNATRFFQYDDRIIQIIIRTFFEVWDRVAGDVRVRVVIIFENFLARDVFFSFQDRTIFPTRLTKRTLPVQ